MSNLVLIDSCYYISLLSQRVNPFTLLDEYVPDYDFCICGIVWMEVLRGRSDPFVRARFEERFCTMQFIDLTPAGWQRAASIAWEMDRRGCPIPATDLAIAACAIEHDAALLTFDRHFEGVPGLSVVDKLM
ncbi:MAG: PIN domain-containing protein [Opitutaceae bacterium]|jgi:predicted nucleic acid-binding protein